jgi:peptidoglycan/LPS O-acetylase OafA/YrhL
MKYRKDIDGLRALSVILVVLYHAFPEWLPGGFIGVDIFFVISGFLITSIILMGLRTNQFNFFTFYGNRIRRIFPALIIVLLTSYVFGWFTLLASEYQQFGQHLLGGSAFFANYIFWKEAGYFDSSAYSKPLLHLWSLAIEEQFYILWPASLWLITRLRINLLLSIIFLGLLSFLFNLVYSDRAISLLLHTQYELKDYFNLSTAFYAPQSRFWELLAGAFLAWANAKKRNPSSTQALKISLLSEIRPALGILLIGSGALFIQTTDPYPSYWALIPVFGAMLVISSRSGALCIHYLLSNKVMVGIGLISYPLYLWHWPILSYLYIVAGEMPNASIRLLAIVASFILAIITYYLVEIPIRHGRYLDFKAGILLLCMGILAGLGLTTYNQNGFKSRIAAELMNVHPGDIRHDDFHKYSEEHFYPCKPDHIYKKSLSWASFVRCQQSQPGSTIDIAIIGDSHAEHLFIGLAESLPSKNIVYYLKPGYPFIENKEYSEIFDHVIENHSIKVVILTMAWWRIIDRSPEQIRQQVLKTAQLFLNAGKVVYMTDDVPGGAEAIRCKGIRWISKGLLLDQPCFRKGDMLKGSDFKEPFPLAVMLNAVKSNPEIKLLETYKYFCNENGCTMLNENNILYRDSNHLNILGSRFVGSQLVKEYPELKK